MVERGFVTYSNEAKTELLGVPAELIAAHGAVSEPVARAMAEGALARSRADVAVAITGIAGPGGGTAAKPVGLVHFALAPKGRATRHLERRYGDLGRASAIRRASAVGRRAAAARRGPADHSGPGATLPAQAGRRPRRPAPRKPRRSRKARVEHDAHQQAEREALELVVDVELDLAACPRRV